MANLSIEPNERITFKTRYEDAHVIVVGKPAGVVTAPGKGHERDSLLNGLFAKHGSKLQNLGAERDFGLLHRLDKQTSGLVIAALSLRAYEGLRASFEAREVGKYYWAVVKGAPSTTKGVINRPIAEFMGEAMDDTRTKKLSRVSSAGKPAITAFRVIASNPAASLVECRAVTGRLHQVRVHMEFIGCPILGDELYATPGVRSASPRLALHAHRVVFKHPISGDAVDVHAPWPADLKGLLKRLSLPRPDLMEQSESVKTEEEASE